MSTAKSKAGLALLSSLSPNALTTRVSRLDGGARHDWGIWHSAASPIRSAWAAWRLKLSIYTVLPNTLYFLDRIGQSGPPMVADEILEIRRSNPHQATNFDRPQAFARIRVGYIAAHLLGTYCQDLGCIGNREQRFQLAGARRPTSFFGRGLVLECRPGQGRFSSAHRQLTFFCPLRGSSCACLRRAEQFVDLDKLTDNFTPPASPFRARGRRRAPTQKY